MAWNMTITKPKTMTDTWYDQICRDINEGQDLAECKGRYLV